MNKMMIKMLVFTEIFFFMSLIMSYVYMVYYPFYTIDPNVLCKLAGILHFGNEVY